MVPFREPDMPIYLANIRLPTISIGPTNWSVTSKPGPESGNIFLRGSESLEGSLNARLVVRGPENTSTSGTTGNTRNETRRVSRLHGSRYTS